MNQLFKASIWKLNYYYLPFTNKETETQSGYSQGFRASDFKKTAVLEYRAEHFAGDFPGGAVVKNLPASEGDTGLSPRPGRSHVPRSN